MASWRTAPPELVYVDAPGQQIKMLGSFPVVASFCRRLGIAEVIDDRVPIRDVAAVSAGQAVEAPAARRCRIWSARCAVNGGDAGLPG